MKKFLPLLCLTVAALLISLPAATQQKQSWVITGAQIADGTGAPLRRANVRIEGDRITKIGDFKPKKDETEVRADGLVLAPGFIDTHNHSSSGLLTEPAAVSQISQGITTILLGPDGGSPFPVAEYFQKIRANPLAPNIQMTVGHATIRRRVMGDDFRRAARPDEIAAMEKLVEQAMNEGAVGLSTGLEYEVGSYATTDEVVALSRVAAKHGGFYISHMRDEADLTLQSVRELITIAEQARIPAQITHVKVGTVGVWGKAPDVVKLVEDARRRGLDVTADCYPYTAWQSNLKVLVPNKRWDDPASVKKALDDVGGAKNISITRLQKFPQFEWKTLEEAAQSEGLSPVDFYIRIVTDDSAGIIGHTMTEEDMRVFYVQPWTMVSSDGGINNNHPRGTGTFPRVLGRFVREKKWLTLEDAIRKMTSLPASRLKLKDRGIIKKGMKADLVLFNPETVNDRSTFAEPRLLSTGIEKVYVNGQLVWDGKEATTARPGLILPRGK